jgi:hypothetical protein
LRLAGIKLVSSGVTAAMDYLADQKVPALKIAAAA